MNLNLSSICECLPSHLTFTKLIENNKKQLYSFPKLYTKNVKIEDNSLYIGSYEDFPKHIFAKENIAIICVSNSFPLKTTKCSLLQIKENISIIEAYSTIVEIFNKYNKWEIDILKLLACHSTLKEIIQISKPLLEGNQLNCINLNGEILAGTINASLVNMDSINNSHLPLPILTQNIDQIKPALKKGESQYGTSYVNEITFNFIQRNLYINGQSIGLINCTDTNHPLKEIEFLLVNKLCDLIEESLTEDFILRTDSSVEIGTLLKNILEGTISKTNTLKSNLYKLVDLQKRFFSCLCLRISDSESGIFLSKFLSVNLQHYLPNAITCSVNNDIIILLCSSNKSEITEMIKDFKKLLHGCMYHIGVSNTFQDIENVKHYYQQALIAIDIQHRSNKVNRIYYFSDNVLSYTIDKATEFLPIQHLCHPGIIALYKYDQSSGTSYINTLKVYFENGQNTIKTAETLFIHRSTLLYRLDRIKEIIEDDWDSYKNRLYIMLSLQMIIEKNL